MHSGNESAAWHSGGRRHRPGFRGETEQREVPLATIQRVDAVCDRFEAAWQEGRRPQIEDYLDPEQGDQRDLLLRELIDLDVDYRRRDGDVCTAAEYERRFPDSGKLIQEVFRTVPTTVVQDHFAVSTDGQRDRRGPRARQAAAPGLGQFSDYELLDEIARGGMGVVYRALQTKANRIVALKMILSGQFASDEQVQRFHSEAEAAARLDHPNIVPVFDVGKHAGHHYFTMGYVDGVSLAERLREGPLPPREAASLVRTICNGIACAHEHGVIHRDLKPSNVLLDGNGQPRITDFGLAKQVASDSGLTATGQVMGTPSYMPPEQAAGDYSRVGTRSDIYSLGAILYTLVTGRPPFQASQVVETLRQVIDDDPVEPRVLNPAVDRDLETICLKCLEKKPADRYGSAFELRDELDCYLNGRPIVARAITRRERAWRWCRRQPLVAGSIFAAVASLLIGTGVSVYFAILAQQRAEDAQHGTRVALTALETVINTVQDRLRSIPEAREIRRELLRDSLRSLQQVSRQVQTQSRVDRDTALALIELAMLFVELGDDEGLNSEASAESSFRSAVDILSELVAADDRDPQLLADQARALSLYGNFYLNHDRPGPAEKPLWQALGLYRQLASDHPGHERLQYQVAASLCDWADLLAVRRQFEEAIGYFEEASQLVQRLVRNAPDNVEYQLLLSQCYEKTGDACHDLHQNDLALASFQRSFEINMRLHEADPDSPALLDSLSINYERLGNHWLQLGDPGQALEMYQEMHDLIERAIAGDPANRLLREGLADAHQKIAKAAAALGDAEAAREAWQESGRIRSELARSADTNTSE